MVEQRKASSTERLLDEMQAQLRDAETLFENDVRASLVNELTNEIHEASGLYFYLPFRTFFAYSFQQNLWKDGKKTEYHSLIPDMLKAS